MLVRGVDTHGDYPPGDRDSFPRIERECSNNLGVMTEDLDFTLIPPVLNTM